MNNYHLYEEIGKGKFSTVYKGRKRYTITYVAVKSIEKCRRDKVMTEVNIMSQLRHVNVVTFLNWYETKNHLWIIFGYCAGGDLMRLLKQDGRLPEDQVRLFGLDIAAGLLHVHAHGVIYSDLKPANVLSDEDGTLKLCDFGHSQRLDDIQRAISEKATLPRRGTPVYMAPELLQEGGMHSFASDLWALGCVLHEMLAGRPPFHSSSFQDLLQMVLHNQTPMPQASSPEMQALLAALLRKNPLARAEWPAVRAHGFWQGQTLGEDSEAETLPEQPHLEELRRSCVHLESTHQPVGPATSRAQQPVAAATAPDTIGGRSGRAGLSEPEIVPAMNLMAQDAARDEQTQEPEAEAEPPQQTYGTSRGRDLEIGAAALAHQAGTFGAATVAPASPAGSLRARLGAAAFAKTRELVTAAESGVKPISRNPQIEEPEPLDTPADLPFVPLRLEEICSRTHADAEAFFSKVYKWVAQGSLEQKIGALKYLEQISSGMQVADLIANSKLLPLVLRMLHARRAGERGQPGSGAAAAPPLRARLLALIGQLLRSVTYLEPAVADLGLFDILLEGLRERDAVVRRRSAGALGELLFYVATQPTPTSPVGQKTGEGQSVGGGSWQVPSNVLQALVQLVSAPGEDEVVQHYAVKTIENIATQCPAIAQQWFFSDDLIRGLRLHVRRGSWDPFRLCCLASIAHLLRGQPEGGQGDLQLAEPELVTIGLQELAPHGVLHSLQLVSAIVLRVPSGDIATLALPETVMDLLMGVTAQPRYSAALRARASLLMTLLCALDSPSELPQLRGALDRSLVAHIDRLSREKDRFVAQCVAAMAMVMEVVAVNALQALVEGLRQLVAITEQAPAMERAKPLAEAMPVLLHMLSSATFCTCILGSRALPLLGHVGELCARVSWAQATPGVSDPLHELQPTVLMVMEVLATQQGLLLEHALLVVRHVMSTLTAFLSSARCDVRVLALKVFSDICMVLLNDSHVFDPIAEKPGETTLLLEALLCSRVLPLLPTLLTDEDPSPSCSFRLLAALLSRSSAAAYAAVRQLGLAPRLLVALEDQHGLTVHSSLLSFCLLWGHEVHVADLAQVGVLDAVYTVFLDAADGQLDFALLDTTLCVAEEALGQARLPPSGGANTRIQSSLRDLGRLAWALPPLAALCVPLAQAELAPLLDRATACCQYLVDIARLHVQDGSGISIELPAKGMASLLEAIASVSRWRAAANAVSPAGQGSDTTEARTQQRRLFAVLTWAVTVGGAAAEVRAELASRVEQLLRERVFADDSVVASDARSFIAAAVGHGIG